MPEVTITKTDEKPQKIPPDGGWGWYIVVAQALSNVRCDSFFQLDLIFGFYRILMNYLLSMIFDR